MGTKARELVSTDVCKVIEMLNKAYADEWLAALQYWTAAKVVRGVFRKQVAAELMEHAREEYEHAEKLADRILQLGGTILLTPDEILREANCAYTAPVPEECCCRIVEQTLASERCSIAVYRRIMEETCGGKDPVTYHLAMKILKEELEHEDEFQTIHEEQANLHDRLRKMMEK